MLAMTFRGVLICICASQNHSVPVCCSDVKDSDQFRAGEIVDDQFLAGLKRILKLFNFGADCILEALRPLLRRRRDGLHEFIDLGEIRSPDDVVHHSAISGHGVANLFGLSC